MKKAAVEDANLIDEDELNPDYCILVLSIKGSSLSCTKLQSKEWKLAARIEVDPQKFMIKQCN